MSYMDELNFWLNDDYFDQKTKEELLAIRNNEAEVEDRFYKELIRSIDEHLRPIVYGYNDQELDDLCQQILSMNCNVVMERILDRISTLDVPSLLMKNRAYLEE